MVDSSDFCPTDLPYSVMQKTRGSTLFAGAILARCKTTFIAGSGGCHIGSRPIDLHLYAFEKMGMTINEEPSGIRCRASNMRPCVIRLAYPSVGATENIMLASSLTRGRTVIINAAAEPEISNLSDFLRSIGVEISGDGTSVVVIKGADSLSDGEVTVMGDRVVASTYAICAAMTLGSLEICSVNPRHLSPVIAYMRQMGVNINCMKNSFSVSCHERTHNVCNISTGPYPLFPTDCQPLITALMCVSDGVGMIRENVFENRFGHCHRLCCMGADITIKGKSALVNGVKNLNGADVDACDLRCGATLVCAALAAKGTSRITGTHYIDRGYENLGDTLRSIGADIERIE